MKGVLLMANNAAVMIAGLVALFAMIVGAPAWAQPLSFAQAREMVLENHEGLKALRERRAAAEEAVRQASAYLNPEIEVETKDFGRSELEVVLTQPILIGGKRGAAVGVARREAEIAELEIQSLQISLEAELIRRFAPVLSTYQKLNLVDSMIEVSAGNIEAVRRLVEAGAIKEIDALRAELERDELSLERAELERSLAEAEMKLSELWGDVGSGFEGMRGSLPVTLSLATLKELGTAMERHPDVRMLDTQGLLAKAEMDQAKAEGRPELALSAGYLHEHEADEQAVIAGASLSLPIFNRNKGAVAAKRHKMAAVEHEARLVRLERSTELAALYSEFEVSGRELNALSGDVLSKAVRIHRTLADFYVQGKTGILDVLAARGHLLELQMKIVDLTEERALVAADIQELTGYRIEVIQ
jgi:cobalt-zinc-cadmium efflux system outer membrane protein